MRTFASLLLGTALTMAFTGCGGDGTYDDTTTQPAPVLVQQVKYWPDGMVQESGTVQQGTDIKEGEWWAFYDESATTASKGIYQRPENRKYFNAGTWVQTEPWRLWNKDGSIRDDYTDAMSPP